MTAPSAAHGLLICVSGPSGVGKGTIIREVLRRRPGMAHSISVTTRAPRPGEQHGVDYYFSDRDSFRRMLEAGEISWAKAKDVCKAVLAAPAGQERAALEAALARLRQPAEKAPRLLTYRAAAKRLKTRKEPFKVTGEDLAALLQVLRGKNAAPETVERVRAAFPGLLDS